MNVNRREFMQTMSAASATAALASTALGQAASKDTLNLAIIGFGRQGRILVQDARKDKNVKFRALCDAWEYKRKVGKRLLKAYKHNVNTYADYREMLAKEKDLDAVIVATPDFWHAEHTIECLKAGKHVYCEKEMSNSLEKAKDMVNVANETGKLLQIGHQRRSNPVYLLAQEMIEQDDACGFLTNLYGQWRRPVQPKLKWPAKYTMKPEELKQFGYASMDHFYNWRWYKEYSAGPIADLGSHQIDIFSWFLGADPISISAVGGKDYYPDRDWYEDVMALYEYEHEHKGRKGSARAYYQVLNTNGFGDYYEKYSGTKGTIMLSENPKHCLFAPEPGAGVPPWLEDVETVPYGQATVYPLLSARNKRELSKKSPQAAELMKVWEDKNVHQFHLENFFGAIRAGDKKKLTCPGEIAYATAVSVLNVIPAIEAGKKITFTHADYKV